MEKIIEYEELKSQCLRCNACSLSEQRTQVVFDDGNPGAGLMFIGEAPGADEDAQGIPFIGRAGKLLNKMLESVNLDRKTETYITNICKCRPPGNRNPAREEASTCRHWLDKQISLIKPKILVLIGAVAMKSFLNGKLAITKQRGTWHKYKDIDTTVIFHPSYLLRYPSEEVGKPKWQTFQDLKAIKSAMN